MTLRQYHTPEGIIEREPTKEELKDEFKLRKDAPDLRMTMDAVAELTGKKVEEVEQVFEKNYKG